MKVFEAIAASGIEAREARLLLAEVCGFSQASLAASPEQDVPFEVENAFLDFVRRRREGEPVAYILGRKEFYGLDLSVNPSVLIPRPETELLVDLALERHPDSVLDLGTGSGAIALALKYHLKKSRVVAVDADLAALNTAKRNAAKLNLEIDFRHGRWFEPVAGERFELIVSNPPYVASGDPHLAELRFEPQSALLAGSDGLDCIRGIAAAASAHLLPGAWLLLEHGLGQDGEVRKLLAGAGLELVATWPDLSGIARVTGGKLKS
ncbi:MAG TPA: peptide chain release factor N(5)-glutamine methyltransferase [Burkholderiales bacterium]|nr:peptide chain release factor N(5)-glutamine methyltransferase [Burkholderiales bacterium]